MSANWKDILGEANKNYDVSKRPADISVGIIEEVNPIKIRLSENTPPVEGNMLIFSETVGYLKTTDDKTEIGKRVIVIVGQGGQRFYVMDKAGE